MSSDAKRANVVWALHGSDRAVANYVAQFVRADRACSMAIAGGNTPRSILAKLSENGLPWHRTVIVPTDERQVAETHRASNYGMIYGALRGTPAMVHRLDEIPPDPHFDLIWLGMACDGKIASLFTHDDICSGGGRAVIVREKGCDLSVGSVLA